MVLECANDSMPPSGSGGGNGEDKPADWHVQTGKDPALSRFRENVAECLATVINIGSPRLNASP